MQEQEGWESKKSILIILAHPDDPEFFMGGTIARWVQAGHSVSYCLLTKGDKGAIDLKYSAKELSKIRVNEQKFAANVLGVHNVTFFDYPDGFLVPDLRLRKQIVKLVRSKKPDVLVTCDPTNLFSNHQYINHPDHRAAGQVVVDAVFPAVGSPMFYLDLATQGYSPHKVTELWMSLTNAPDVILDVSPFWSLRLAALKEHKSQIGDTDEFEKYIRGKLQNSEDDQIIYTEKFRRIIFRTLK